MGSAAVAQLHLSAHGHEKVALRMNVAHVRNIFQNHGLVCEESGGHRGQCGILGAADADASHQGIATTNYKFIHKTLWRDSSVPEVNPDGPATRDGLSELGQGPGRQRCSFAGTAIR